METNEMAVTGKVLFVDDEENILKSLTRLLMDEEFEVLTAGSGASGLEILRGNSDICLIVSDQRMPAMNGVEFLERAREIAPDALRIMLTGYADITATIDAINKGGAYRYLTKPWQDDDFVQTIRDAVKQSCLLQENRRLTELVNRQNEELKEWNANLKSRVLEQTAQIRKQNEDLRGLNEQLRDNYQNTIRAFAGLLELRDQRVRNHSRNVAELAVGIATELGLSREETETIRVAALLHDIGEIGIPDSILSKDPDLMTEDERSQYYLHAVRGQTAIDSVEALRAAGILIRHHHESFDGAGAPDGLQGDKIPMGARIIALADWFDRKLAGLRGTNARDLAMERVRNELGRKLDPALFPAFQKMIDQVEISHVEEDIFIELEVNHKDLCEGMILSRDVFSGTGILLLKRGSELDFQNILSLKRYYRLDPPQCGVFVVAKQ